MNSLKFRVKRQFNPRGKWTAQPQASLVVWLTCPRCRQEYKLAHGFCGIAIDVRDALVLHECSVCKENGQDAIVPDGVADCPRCGLECRDVAQVEDELESTPRPSSRYNVQPKGRCFVCGNPALHVHHVDWNHANNSPENRVPVCEWCHTQAHKLGKPLFDEMVDRVRKDPRAMAALRQTSGERYRKLHGR
jgi:hypothetical protein